MLFHEMRNSDYLCLENCLRHGPANQIWQNFNSMILFSGKMLLSSTPISGKLFCQKWRKQQVNESLRMGNHAKSAQ